MENRPDRGKVPFMKPRLTSVRLAGGYSLELSYDDGVTGVLDFSEHVGKGVFRRWEREENFRLVHIGEDGQLEWDEDIDFCPDALYLKITGMKPEEIFPKLAALHA